MARALGNRGRIWPGETGRIDARIVVAALPPLNCRRPAPALSVAAGFCRQSFPASIGLPRSKDNAVRPGTWMKVAALGPHIPGHPDRCLAWLPSPASKRETAARHDRRPGQRRRRTRATSERRGTALRPDDLTFVIASLGLGSGASRHVTGWKSKLRAGPSLANRPHLEEDHSKPPGRF